MIGRIESAPCVVRLVVGLLCALTLVSCAKIKLPKHLKSLNKDSLMLLGKKKMELKDPIFVRIFKEESELEIWKQRIDGHFYHFKTYPICTWSGKLGPKRKQGDKQAPEGFYKVNRQKMNPNSKFHLAFNLGYPNAYDRAHLRTGDFLMVHGKCTSAGCYAMTDPLIEEIYALAREALNGGQKEIHVHAFPFRMDQENMLRHIRSPEFLFWQRLKEGYDYFELTRTLPQIAICNRQYHVNVAWKGPKPKALGNCPKFTRPELKPFSPVKGEEQLELQRISAPGIKKRSFAHKHLNKSSVYGLSRDKSSLPTTSEKAQTIMQQDLIGSFIRLSKPTDTEENKD